MFIEASNKERLLPILVTTGLSGEKQPVTTCRANHVHCCVMMWGTPLSGMHINFMYGVMEGMLWV